MNRLNKCFQILNVSEKMLQTVKICTASETKKYTKLIFVSKFKHIRECQLMIYTNSKIQTFFYY